MKIQKVKPRGYSRRVYALIFVSIFALAGTGYLLYSRAEEGLVMTDTGVAMQANTSPSLNSDIAAFNGGLSTRMQFRYYSAQYGGNQSYAYGTAVNPGNIVDTMMTGTSPSVSGNYITYQSSKGILQVYNWTTGQIINTAQPMMAGTSPSISGNLVAFQSSSTVMSYWNISTNKVTNTNQGMMARSSPSISGDIIAYQANTSILYYWRISTGQSINTNQSMRVGTSPSIGGNYIVFQANTSGLVLWDLEKNAPRNTGLGMMAGTSPSISGSKIAFQANVGTLYYWDMNTEIRNTGYYMKAGTSPSISGNTIAFQGSNSNLSYYVHPNTPPPPTVTLTGPSSVNQGNGATLTYKTANTNSCKLAEYAFDPTQSIDGAFYVNLINATTTYTITCTGTSGGVASASWTVSAVGPPSGTITGPPSVVTGLSPTLTISTQNVANCTVNGVSVSPNGTYNAPEITDYTQYELKCGGADGSGTALLSYTGVSVSPLEYVGKGNPADGTIPPDTDQIASAAAKKPSTKKGYYYVSPNGVLKSGVLGMSADILTGSPRVGGRASHGSHSLAQIGLHHQQNGNFKTINGVEFGWTVGSVNGDSKPRIFVFNVIGGYDNYTKHPDRMCYNGCGFVSTSSIKPGRALGEGTVHNYKVSYSAASERWNLYFDGDLFGYYPASRYSEYSGRDFHWGNSASPWGEVYNPGGQCIEMGNGVRGGNKGAAYIKNFRVQYQNGWTNGVLTKPLVSNSYNYNYGNKTNTSLTFGGPGGC